MRTALEIIQEPDPVATTIFGASDDLIEVMGLVREEFYLGAGDRSTLEFSDGSAVSVEYDDDGIWRIHLVEAGACTWIRHACETKPDLSDEDKFGYSDAGVLTGAVEWVRLRL